MSYLLLTSIDVCITLYRLAYADYLLSSMMNLSLVSRRINLLYDIGCKLESHWKVSGSASLCAHVLVNLAGQFTKA